MHPQWVITIWLRRTGDSPLRSDARISQMGFRGSPPCELATVRSHQIQRAVEFSLHGQSGPIYLRGLLPKPLTAILGRSVKLGIPDVHLCCDGGELCCRQSVSWRLVMPLRRECHVHRVEQSKLKPVASLSEEEVTLLAGAPRPTLSESCRRKGDGEDVAALFLALVAVRVEGSSEEVAGGGADGDQGTP